MELRDLFEDVETLGLRGDPRTAVTAVVHDSRRVRPGALFCCIPGERADGHAFAQSAVAAGAEALLVERWLDLPVAQVRVPSVRGSIGRVAARFHGNPSARMTVIGVTGTNGKTTTTYLLEAIAREAGRHVGVIGTIETRIDGRRLPGELTTPEATDLQELFVGMLADGVDVVGMEVSSHALALGRVDGTEFAAAVFTNLSHDHLDFHESLDAYFEAKARLFDPGRTTVAVVNAADPHGALLAERSRSRGLATLTYAVEAVPGVTLDVAVRDVSLHRDRTECVLVAPAWGEPVRVRSRLVGSFNLANVLAAAAGALAAGFDLAAVAKGLEAPVRVPGRFEPVDAGQPFTVLVDYAHTPDALAQALTAAREIAADHRVLVVFGCGGDRDREKRPVMGSVAATGADSVYVTSDNPRSEDPAAIVDDIVAGIADRATPPFVDLDRRRAITRALTDAAPGDVVLVAGKGHETGQTVGDTVHPFDDRDVVLEALQASGASGCG